MFYFKKNKKTQVLVSIVAIAIVVVMVLSMIASVAMAQETASESNVSSVELTLPTLFEDDLLEKNGKEVLPQGVYLEGHSLEGMTADEAVQYTNAYANDIMSRSITLAAQGEEFYYDGGGLSPVWHNTDAAQVFYGMVLTGTPKERMQQAIDRMKDPYDQLLLIEYNTQPLIDQINQLAQQYGTPAVNAAVYLNDDHEFVTVPGENGEGYDSKAAADELLAMVESYKSTDSMRYEMTMSTIFPEYSEEDFEFSNEPLGSYTTKNLGIGNRYDNIELSAMNMNGHYFFPGETVSAKAMYGDISEAGGYEMAPGYQSGKQVQAMGGGICQTTTTLYNAVLRAEFDNSKIDRRGHSMLVTYVPPSMDATVSDDKDFTFVNTTNSPIYIESYVEGDTVTVNIWGKETRPENRTIDFTYEVLELDWPDQLYYTSISDEICTYGYVDVAFKIQTEVDPHPYVHSRSYKQVYIDGELSQTIPLNEDIYGPMTGTIYTASDCTYYAYVEESGSPDAVYPYLGSTITIQVQHWDGASWMSGEEHYY